MMQVLKPPTSLISFLRIYSTTLFYNQSLYTQAHFAHETTGGGSYVAEGLRIAQRSAVVQLLAFYLTVFDNSLSEKYSLCCAILMICYRTNLQEIVFKRSPVDEVTLTIIQGH